MGVCSNEGEFVLLSQQVLSEIVPTYLPTCGRGGGLMVSALVSGTSGPGSGPGSHGAFLHQVGTSDFNLCAWYLCGPVVRVLVLRSGDPGFKTRSDHSFNLILVVPGSTYQLHLQIANWFVSGQLGFLTVVVVVYFCCFVLFHWP